MRSLIIKVEVRTKSGARKLVREGFGEGVQLALHQKNLENSNVKSFNSVHSLKHKFQIKSKTS